MALFWKLADTPGDAERLMRGSESSTQIEADTWSADGQTLLFFESGGSTRPAIGVFTMGGDGSAAKPVRVAVLVPAL